MKLYKYIKVGSSYFFNTYEDYVPSDLDYLCIVDDSKIPHNTNMLNMNLGKKHLILCRNLDKTGFINDLIDAGSKMRGGQFLIPEFNEYINFTIDDLKSICYIFNEMDSKHSYEKIIADAYIENNGFFLTDEQRDMAYKEYKKTRNI